MATEIKMPQLSDTMYSGKILQWRKKEGEQVARGEILAEVETDKANLEIESFYQGVLLKIITPAESTANVGDVIGLIGAAGEVASSVSAAANSTHPVPEVTTVQKAAPTPTPVTQNASPVTTAPVSLDQENASNTGRIKVSPLARKIAQERNIDLSLVQGTGPSGRIVRKDLEVSSTAPSSETRTTSNLKSSETSAPSAGTLQPLSKMRQTIARRMQQSVTEAPHFYVTTAINMREASRLREILKTRAEYKGISLNHMLIKACAYALFYEPRVNCAIRDQQLYNPGQINIGIITAVEDGLMIPVIHQAEKLSLADLVYEARAVVDRARAGRPSSTDLTGGTFSISNMGMFDVENFTAIINPGQGAILAVGACHEEPVVEQGQITVALRMKVTISVDHRIIDGVMAGNFLKYLKEALETPALLIAAL